MALVLTIDPEDFAGRGNYDSDNDRLMPAGPRNGRWLRTGGDAWQPEFGKGSYLVFRPWEAVVCPGGRPQEDAILRHARRVWGDAPPVRRLDFRGAEEPEVMKEYLRRHPDLLPKGEPGSPEHAQAWMTLISRFEGATPPQGRSAFPTMRFGDSPDKLASQAQSLKSAEGAAAGRRLGAQRPGDAVSEAEGAADAREHAQAVYDASYAEHRAKGRTEAQAAHYAERTRKAALRRAEG